MNRIKLILTFVLVSIVALASVVITRAQTSGSTMVTTGQVVVGDINSFTPAINFTFPADPSQPTTIMVEGLSAGFIPTFSVYDEVGNLVTTATAREALRDAEALVAPTGNGTYTIQVSGVEGSLGQFFMRLSSFYSTVAALPIFEDEFILDAVSADRREQQYTFFANQERTMTLMIASTSLDAGPEMALRDVRNGITIAEFELPSTGVCLRIAPGNSGFVLDMDYQASMAQEGYSIMLVPGGEFTGLGDYSLSLNCQDFNEVSAFFSTTPQVTANSCVVTAANGAMVYAEPSIDSAVVGTLTGSSVAGARSGAGWYLITVGGTPGWVQSGSVTTVGACDGLANLNSMVNGVINSATSIAQLPDQGDNPNNGGDDDDDDGNNGGDDDDDDGNNGGDDDDDDDNNGGGDDDDGNNGGGNHCNVLGVDVNLLTDIDACVHIGNNDQCDGIGAVLNALGIDVDACVGNHHGDDIASCSGVGATLAALGLLDVNACVDLGTGVVGSPACPLLDVNLEANTINASVCLQTVLNTLGNTVGRPLNSVTTILGDLFDDGIVNATVNTGLLDAIVVLGGGTTNPLINANVGGTTDSVGSLVNANLLSNSTGSDTSLIGVDVAGTGSTGSLVDVNLASDGDVVGVVVGGGTSGSGNSLVDVTVGGTGGTTGSVVDVNVGGTTGGVNVIVGGGTTGTGGLLGVNIGGTNPTTVPGAPPTTAPVVGVDVNTGGANINVGGLLDINLGGGNPTPAPTNVPNQPAPQPTATPVVNVNVGGILDVNVGGGGGLLDVNIGGGSGGNSGGNSGGGLLGGLFGGG